MTAVLHSPAKSLEDGFYADSTALMKYCQVLAKVLKNVRACKILADDQSQENISLTSAFEENNTTCPCGKVSGATSTSSNSKNNG